MSLETMSIDKLSNKFLQPIENIEISLPSNLHLYLKSNETVTRRVCLLCLNTLHIYIYIYIYSNQIA